MIVPKNKINKEKKNSAIKYRATDKMTSTIYVNLLTLCLHECSAVDAFSACAPDHEVALCCVYISDLQEQSEPEGTPQGGNTPPGGSTPPAPSVSEDIVVVRLGWLYVLLLSPYSVFGLTSIVYTVKL